ncbi:MAG: hypothetical protein LAO51_12075 [Acidobacteriia bacterium]|nr:hypothetical protein [Terriglobia bacterium]
MDLVHRTRSDRVVSAFRRVHRFTCRDAACGWSGLKRSSRRRPEGAPGKGMKPWMWLVVVLVAAAAAAAMVLYLDARSPVEATDASPAP